MTGNRWVVSLAVDTDKQWSCSLRTAVGKPVHRGSSPSNVELHSPQ